MAMVRGGNTVGAIILFRHAGNRHIAIVSIRLIQKLLSVASYRTAVSNFPTRCSNLTHDLIVLWDVLVVVITTRKTLPLSFIACQSVSKKRGDETQLV